MDLSDSKECLVEFHKGDNALHGGAEVAFVEVFGETVGRAVAELHDRLGIPVVIWFVATVLTFAVELPDDVAGRFFRSAEIELRLDVAVEIVELFLSEGFVFLHIVP